MRVLLSTEHRMTMLTQREHELLLLLAEGLPTDEIVGRMNVGKSTVRTHTLHVLAKLGARSQREAAVMWWRQQALDFRSNAEGANVR